jgi:hypothetical protein
LNRVTQFQPCVVAKDSDLNQVAGFELSQESSDDFTLAGSPGIAGDFNEEVPLLETGFFGGGMFAVFANVFGHERQLIGL